MNGHIPKMLRLFDVAMNLCHQRVYIGKFLFVTEFSQEVHADFLAIKIAVKLHKVNFQTTLHFFKCRI